MGLVVLLCTASPAHAQLHWDGSVQVGAAKRFARGSVSPSPDFGPAGTLAVHLAIIPFVRGGVYGSYDFAKLSNGELRHFVAGGIRGKFLSPIPERPFRTWVFAGLGYTRSFDGLGSGGFVEVPVGVGASYELRKPFQLSAELGARFGVGFHGSSYDSAVPRGFVGSEFAALFLTVGLTIDR